LIRRPPKIASRNGTITTLDPVIKAAFDGVVYSRPVVCSAYPPSMKNPIWIPAHIVAGRISRTVRQNSSPSAAAAIANRTARYTNTETSASASFTATNVAPQISEQKSSARSARILRLIPGVAPDCGEGRSSGMGKSKCTDPRLPGQAKTRANNWEISGEAIHIRVAVTKSPRNIPRRFPLTHAFLSCKSFLS